LQLQEALVLAVDEILLTPEQGELILVRTAVVGAEGAAVAALVTHTIHVDDLAHPHTGHSDGHVGTVGAHLGAGLAHGGAAQAAAVIAAAAIGADVAALGQRLLIVGVDVLVHIDVHVEVLNGAGGLGSAGNGLHHGAGALLAVSDDVDVLHGGLQGVGVDHSLAAVILFQDVGGVLLGVHLLDHVGDDRAG